MSKILKDFMDVCVDNKNKVAYVYSKGKKIVNKTYEDIQNDVLGKVKYLKESGVKQSDNILLFAKFSYELLTFMLSSMLIGASVMYIENFKKERLDVVKGKLKYKYVVVSNKTKNLKCFVRYLFKNKKVLLVDKKCKSITDEIYDLNDTNDSTPALLTMTTGSTGMPKIAVRTHMHLYEQLRLINDNMEHDLKNEVVLTTSYMYVFANLIKTFTSVVPSINMFNNNDRKLKKEIKKFKDVGATMMITTPDFLLRVDNVFEKLKKVYFGGAILNLYEANKIVENYNGININYIYGSTECNLISIIDLSYYRDELRENGKSKLGKIAKGVKIRIQDTGEVLVTSKALIEKYMDDDSSNKIRDDKDVVWHNTHDCGIVENDVLYYKGRCDKKVQNTNVYSSEIEQMVCVKYPTLTKCAFLNYKNVNYLFVEKPIDNVETFLQDEYGIKSVNIIVMKKIPCDIKHHTKINYIKLEHIIEKRYKI